VDQLNGEKIDISLPLNLAVNVSTDAIFPTRGVTSGYEKFGSYALSGFEPIKEGDLERIRPTTLVVGNGFGTGSGREHAPISLKQAGVRKVVCIGGRVEGLFLENCLMLGIEVFEHPHTIEAALEIERTLQDDKFEKAYQDKLRPDIAQSGGISAYNRMRLEGKVSPIAIRHDELPPSYPMTVAEKILARRMINVYKNIHGEKVVLPGDTGFVALHYRMSYEFHTQIIKFILENQLKGIPIRDPASVHLFQDHSALFARIDSRFAEVIQSQHELAEEYGLRVYGSNKEGGLTEGICHTLSVENALVVPGEVGIGTDSHTCSLGVLNAFAWGVGATHFANTLVTNEALVEVPKTIKINLNGNFREGVTTKDLMLYILALDFVKDSLSTNCVFEYAGEGLEKMSLAEQMILTNMAVEGRAMTGIIGRLTPALKGHLEKVKGMTESDIENDFIQSDSGAMFFKKVEVNLKDIEPMVALPGDPRNGIPLSQLSPADVKNIYIGSCTGGNLEDIRAVAEALKGTKLHKGLQLRVQAASLNILEEAEGLGYLDIIRQAGGEIVGLGCGACIGLGPGRVTDEGVTVSDSNRNFPGRMGGRAPVYLTSPLIAAKVAIEGKIGNKVVA